MKSPLPVTEQQGNLLLPLVGLLFATAATLGLATWQTASWSREARQHQALLAAREALIARAATDDNRPGSLPCPDRMTDSAATGNLPGDGKADLFSRNRCPSHLGLLPWVTLDMPMPLDIDGNMLWYIAAPGLRDDDSAQPINSDTPTGLLAEDGEALAAILIAPGSALPGQHRSGLDPAGYLEGVFNDDAQNVTASPGRRGTSNDRWLPITRQEVMAATERRVAHGVRRCLDSHAATLGHYPWPAPFASPAGEGRADAAFGRLPASQPTAGVAGELTDNQQAIARHEGELASAPANAQAAPLAALGERLVFTVNQLKSLETVGTTLSLMANQARSQLEQLLSTLAVAVDNGRIARSEGTTITERSTLALSTVDTLSGALSRYGLEAQNWPAAPRDIESPPDTQKNLRRLASALSDASETFTRQDTAAPRPLQQALVPYAAQVDLAARELLTLTTLIGDHAQAVATQAALGQALAVQAQDTLQGKGGVQEALNAWLAKPTAANRQKLDAAMIGNRQTLAGLQAALTEQIQISASTPASAWPMIWASAHCGFLHATNSWWQGNGWHDSVFYQIAGQQANSTARLDVPGRPPQVRIVLIAGSRLPGQRRPGTSVADYLEAANAHPGRDGDGTGAASSFHQALPDRSFNDQLAY